MSKQEGNRRHSKRMITLVVAGLLLGAAFPVAIQALPTLRASDVETAVAEAPGRVRLSASDLAEVVGDEKPASLGDYRRAVEHAASCVDQAVVAELATLGSDSRRSVVTTDLTTSDDNFQVSFRLRLDELPQLSDGELAKGFERLSEIQSDCFDAHAADVERSYHAGYRADDSRLLTSQRGFGSCAADASSAPLSEAGQRISQSKNVAEDIRSTVAVAMFEASEADTDTSAQMEFLACAEAYPASFLDTLAKGE